MGFGMGREHIRGPSFGVVACILMAERHILPVNRYRPSPRTVAAAVYPFDSCGDCRFVPGNSRPVRTPGPRE